MTKEPIADIEEENPFAVCARGGKYFNNEMANNIAKKLDEEYLLGQVSNVTEVAVSYGVIGTYAVYRPGFEIDDPVLFMLATIWNARLNKDYELADFIKKLLQGKTMIHKDRIEWIDHWGLYD